jgi:hypothetical protein
MSGAAIGRDTNDDPVPIASSAVVATDPIQRLGAREVAKWGRPWGLKRTTPAGHFAMRLTGQMR